MTVTLDFTEYFMGKKNLSVPVANEMIAKYDRPMIESDEDFNGHTIYTYVKRIQFKTEEEAIMFMVEGSQYGPKITDNTFTPGHTSF